MIITLILLIKIFLFGFPYMIILGLMNSITSLLGQIFRKTVLIWIYIVISNLIFFYLYSFWGAYLNAIVETYSASLTNKWLLILLCIVSILAWLTFINKELKKHMKKNSLKNIELMKYDADYYSSSMNAQSLSMSIFIPISFFVFLITNNLHNILYFSLPKYLANVFV